MKYPATPADVGTAACPVRISSLPKLALCPWSWLMKTMDWYGDEAGAPAQTGTLTGRMVELYHAAGDIQAALRQAVAEGRGLDATFPRLPLADYAAAEVMFQGYVRDDRNHPYTVAFDCERTVTGEIDGVVFRGSIDQARIEADGAVAIWDVKSGRSERGGLMGAYALQLAGYVVAYQQTTGRVARAGGIIRMADYVPKSRGGVQHDPFIRAGWDYDTCVELLRGAVAKVLELRSGLAAVVPGTHCNYCLGVPECISSDSGVMCRFNEWTATAKEPS